MCSETLYVNKFKITAFKALPGRLIVGLKDIGIMVYDTDSLQILKIELVMSQMKHTFLTITRIMAESAFDFGLLTTDSGVVKLSY